MNGNSWYKEMAVYQIWCRSFCDGNGDGIGDLWGVLSKLDYIKSLNVNAIWFSPIYPSPNADFGYDVADYRSIHPDFGNLEIFRQVLDGAHERGMKVFMDLVVNHTSDEHWWFKESMKGADNPYHDYYIWRKGTVRGKKRIPPNNWTSMFEGGAWEYNEDIDEYYLHVFSKKQPDLNMANPKVREEVKGIMRFWLDMGVDGFREDVVTYIGKTPGLPSSYPKIPMANGMQHYTNRPEALVYLKEFKNDVLDKYDCYVVAESPMSGPEVALKYLGEGPDRVFDGMIAFEHMTADCFLTDVLRRPFSLRRLKKAMSNWQNTLAGKAWNTLYIENHDHPRIISRYGSEKYPVESGKMLAAMYMLQQGTPFIYQGQEIGMMNNRLPSVDDYVDIQSKNNYKVFGKFFPKSKALKMIQDSSRDNARTPVQWSADENAGFTTGTPWFGINPNYTEVNVAAQDNDSDSLLNFYRRLVRFKLNNPVALYGDYEELNAKSKKLYVYKRCYEGRTLLVICSFTDEPVRFDAPEEYNIDEKGSMIFSNYEYGYTVSNGFTTRPYEMRVYLFGENENSEDIR